MLDYTLVVHVDAFRHRAAPTCIGSIKANVMKGLTKDGVFGFHIIAMKDVLVTPPLNGKLNNRVIEVAQELIDGM